MDKFQRNYLLKIEANDGSTITIKPPFTIDFDVTRNTLSSVNVASIRIYNLSENNRAMIRKDKMDYGNLRKIMLLAGYGDTLSIVLSGDITRAWSTREGTDYVTTIESFDGGFAYANSEINKTYPVDTKNTSVVKDMIDSMRPFGISPGAIGKFEGSLGRGNSVSGSTTEILREITGGSFFIDNGVAYILGENEAIPGEVKVINSESGLLGTPVREDTILTFEMLFEPRILVGQVVSVQSITEANYNGEYKVTAVKHTGTISESVGGRAVTRLELFYGTEKLSIIQRSN